MRTSDLVEQARLYKALGDEIRLLILEALHLHGDTMTVQMLTEYLGKTQSAVSHHLRLLSQARLVEYRKDGFYHYYFITEAREDIVHQALFGGASW